MHFSHNSWAKKPKFQCSEIIQLTLAISIHFSIRCARSFISDGEEEDEDDKEVHVDDDDDDDEDEEEDAKRIDETTQLTIKLNWSIVSFTLELAMDEGGDDEEEDDNDGDGVNFFRFVLIRSRHS